MNRRNFCKLATMALLGSALPTRGASRAVLDEPARPSLPGCRITVLRRQCFSDLQSRYLDDPEAGPCSHFSEGQTFIAETADRAPEGFCPAAWQCVRSHVAAVLDPSSPCDCGLSTPDNGAVIACCNDGTRPVVFKIERT